MCLDFFNFLVALFWPSAGRDDELNELERRKQVKGNGIFSFAKDQFDQDKATRRGGRSDGAGGGRSSSKRANTNEEEEDDDDDDKGEREKDEVSLLVGENENKPRYYASNILETFKPIEISADKPKGTEASATSRQEWASEKKGVELVSDDDQRNNETNNSDNNNKEKISSSSSNNNRRLLIDSRSSMEPDRREVAADEKCPEAAGFRVRTAGRRHLDFDRPYELEDANAPERSHWSGPFHFIQAADCQFGMIDSYVHHRTEPGWSEEIELCERLVRACNQMQPRPLFMIICGDLVDSLPASQIGQKQVADFKRIFAKLERDVPLVCVCGNHDVGDQPTSQTVADYRHAFGDDYFYFTKNDILFIVINSQFYQNREHVEREAREQDLWLERLLAKCPLFKYTIVFEHIPWFLERPDEDDDYFNIRKEVRLGWLQKFKAAGVTKIMCGHYHRNAGGWFEGMELVVTSAIGAQCGSDKSGVRIVRVLDHCVEHQYYAMEDIPLSVELKSGIE